MKNILFCLLILLCTSFMSKSSQYDPKKSTAEVDMVNGFYLFVDSKPVMEYEYLGTINNGTSGAFNPQYMVIRDKILKKARKQYKDANGIILHLNAGGSDKADVIMFK